MEAAEKEKAKKKEAKKAGKKGAKKTDLDEFLESRNLCGPSEIVVKLQENIERYAKEWEPKDPSANFA